MPAQLLEQAQDRAEHAGLRAFERLLVGRSLREHRGKFAPQRLPELLVGIERRRPQRVRDRAVRQGRVTKVDAGPGHDARALCVGPLGELLDHARLADPGLTRDQHGHGIPAAGLLERGLERSEILAAPDERRRGGRRDCHVGAEYPATCRVVPLLHGSGLDGAAPAAHHARALEAGCRAGEKRQAGNQDDCRGARPVGVVG